MGCIDIQYQAAYQIHSLSRPHQLSGATKWDIMILEVVCMHVPFFSSNLTCSYEGYVNV